MRGARPGETGISLVAGLMVLAALLGQPVLFLVALVLLAIGVLTVIWRRYCLRGTSYRRVLSQQRAFVGETVDLEIRIENRKLLPLPWLESEDEFPEALTVQGGRTSPSYKVGYFLLSNLLSLRWYERVTRRYKVRCNARGYHSIGPGRLRSGDIFGFFSDQALVPEEDHLLVYPRVVSLEELGLPSKEPLGGRRTRQALLEDPLHTAGVRDYTPGDSLRRIHWKASARTGNLQVKVLEPSTTLDLLLFLNVATVVPEWYGSIPELLQEPITLTASLAQHAFEAGYRVGLYANTSVQGSDQQVKLAASREPGQLTRIMEVLARAGAFPTVSMERFLQRETRNLPWGATIVVVAGALSEGGLASLVRMRRAGRRVVLVFVGDQRLPAGAGSVPLHRVTVKNAPGGAGASPAGWGDVPRSAGVPPADLADAPALV